MPAKPLTDKQLEEAVALYRQTGTSAAAARLAGIPDPTMRHRILEARRRGLLSESTDAIPRGMPFDRAWQTWLEHIGAARDHYAGPAQARPGSRRRIVAAGDFHVPFHNQEALATLIAKESGRTDTLLIGGDFGDAYAASTYPKYERVGFEEEHAQKTVVLQALSEAFPEIIWLKGSNHSDRYEKRLRENLPRDILSAVMEMTGGVLNPELALAKRFPNVKVQCWTTPDGDEVPWLTLIGDVAFSHAEKYSRTPVSALRAVDEWLTDFKGHLGLPRIRAVVQFHTHVMTQTPWRSDTWLIEAGAMCQMQGYQLKGKIGGRPQRCGYVSMELEDGKLVMDSPKLHWLDAGD